MSPSLLPLIAAVRLVAADPAPSTPSCLTLAAAIVASHPEPAVALALSRAARARAREAGALPPPELMLELEAMPLTEPTLLPDGTHVLVGLSQRYLPAGSRSRFARAAELDAQALDADSATSTRELTAAIAERCLAWSATNRLAVVLTAQRKLLTDLTTAVRARVATGADSLAEVARSEAEGIRLDLAIDRVRSDSRTHRDTLVAVAGEVAIPADPPALASALVIDLPPPEARPELRAAALRVAAQAARVGAEERMANNPGFTLGAGVGGSVDMGLEIMVSASIDLPWWSDIGSARVDAAQAELDAEQQRAAALERGIAAEIATASGERDALARALDHQREELLPALERTLTLERAALAAGRFDLVRWLGAAQALESARIELVTTEHELAVAELRLALVGKALKEVTP